ncbi:hypothetical protein MKX01_018362 [Papaver californicum]|nr:hypothetical protein MKX01_018362 [Papaver californicum]
MGKFWEEYVKMIQGFFSLLVMWIIPCFVLKTISEVIRVIYVDQDSWWISVAILFSLLSSWAYSTIISLPANVLLNLVNSDVTALIDEHVRLRHHLSKISHRFRIFHSFGIPGCECSQVVTLFHTTRYHGIITLINEEDFTVSSIVQVVSIVIFLHATAKISHRAQLTNNSPNPSRMRGSNSVGNFEALANPIRSIPIVFSESDLESLEHQIIHIRLPMRLHTTRDKRLALMYLQSNPAGVTIYGWTVDRELIKHNFRN